MGRLYERDFSGEHTLAYFDGGIVTAPGLGTNILARYDSRGDITEGAVDLNLGSGRIIARFDGSNIYTNGRLAARCSDGTISIGARTLYYEGDACGAAAAAVATVLGGGSSGAASETFGGNQGSTPTPSGSMGIFDVLGLIISFILRFFPYVVCPGFDVLICLTGMGVTNLVVPGVFLFVIPLNLLGLGFLFFSPWIVLVPGCLPYVILITILISLRNRTGRGQWVVYLCAVLYFVLSLINPLFSFLVLAIICVFIFLERRYLRRQNS